MGVRSVSLSVQLHSPRARRTSRDTETETDRGAMAAAVCPPGLPWGAKYYTDVGGVCTRDTSFFGGKPVLNQGVGYAVVLGFGAIFAVVTSFLVSSKNTRLKPLSKFLAQTCLLAKEKKEKQDQQILFGIRVLFEIQAFDQFFCTVPEFDNLPKLLCTWCDYSKNRCGWRRSTSIPDTIPSGSTLQAETSRLDSLPVSLFLRLSSKPPNPRPKMVSSQKIFKMFLAKKF